MTYFQTYFLLLIAFSVFGFSSVRANPEHLVSSTVTQLNATDLRKGLPIVNPTIFTGNDGQRVRRWHIAGSEKYIFELTGNNVNDLEKIVWRCAEYSDKGDYIRPYGSTPLCWKMLIGVLGHLVDQPYLIAVELVGKADEQYPKQITKIVDNISIKTDGEFFSVALVK